MIAALLTFGGCTDDPRGPRLGAAGESCLITNDCAAPLACIENACGGKGDGGAGAGGGGMIVDAGTTSQCDKCLDTTCATELAACDGECFAIEACIEVQCKHLGDIGSSDEGACFANCQMNHSSGKNAHLAVVDCSQMGTCFPPCLPYPQSFDECRAFMDKDICADALAACKTSLDCKNFRDCASVCKSGSECLGCDDTPELAAGRQLAEAYELCVASECISESWLPNML
jgi:hypothetical protein